MRIANTRRKLIAKCSMAVLLAVSAVTIAGIPAASAAPNPIKVSAPKTVTFDSTGTITTVPITVTCTTPMTVWISGTVYQQQRELDEFGFPKVSNAQTNGSTAVQCGPTPTTYDIQFQVPFGGHGMQSGRATLTVDVVSDDDAYWKRLTQQVKVVVPSS